MVDGRPHHPTTPLHCCKTALILTQCISFLRDGVCQWFTERPKPVACWQAEAITILYCQVSSMRKLEEIRNDLSCLLVTAGSYLSRDPRKWSWHGRPVSGRKAEIWWPQSYVRLYSSISVHEMKCFLHFKFHILAQFYRSSNHGIPLKLSLHIHYNTDNHHHHHHHDHHWQKLWAKQSRKDALLFDNSQLRRN